MVRWKFWKLANPREVLRYRIQSSGIPVAPRFPVVASGEFVDFKILFSESFDAVQYIGHGAWISDYFHAMIFSHRVCNLLKDWSIAKEKLRY